LEFFFTISFILFLITQERGFLEVAISFAKKLNLWLQDRNTLIEQSQILMEIALLPVPDIEKVRMGN